MSPRILVTTAQATRTAFKVGDQKGGGSTIAPALAQVGFLGRNNNGNEASATAKAAENFDWAQLVGQVFRIRFAVVEINGFPYNNAVFSLHASLNGNTYFPVNGSSSIVRIVDSALLVHEEATTRQLTSGGGTYEPGAIDDVDGLAGTGLQIDIPAGGVTEIEFCLEIVPGDVNHNDALEFMLETV